MRNSLRLFTIRDKLLILIILVSGCKLEAQDFEARNNPVAESYRYSLYFSDYTRSHLKYKLLTSTFCLYC